MSLILKSIILIPIFGLIVKSPELSCMIYDWEMVRSEHMSGHKNYWECLYQILPRVSRLHVALVKTQLRAGLTVLLSVSECWAV